MPEPITTALATKGVDSAVQSAESFVAKLVGPALGELGAVLTRSCAPLSPQEPIAYVGEGRRVLRDAGVTPASVPLRLLLPLLEGASLEDDEHLSAKWAALLANAAHV